MYVLKTDYVRMIEVTATNLRKDLFNILDRMLETGESVRLVRKGQVVRMNVTTEDAEAEADRRASRFDAYMALGPREGWEDWDVEPLDSGVATYDPAEKFKDL